MPILNVSPDFLVQSTPPKAIKLGGATVREFLPGWQPRYVCDDFAPVNLLLLEHDDGTWATWFLNEDMEHLSSEHRGLVQYARNSLLASYCLLFDKTWNTLVAYPRSPWQLECYKSFFQLPIEIRRQMLDFYLSEFDFATEYIFFHNSADSPPRSKIVDLGATRVLLDATYLQQIFNPSGLQEAYINLLRTGMLTWPSPIDGRELQARHAFYLGGNRFAYRLVDERHNVVFYLIADEIHFRVTCVYVARARLAIMPEALRSQAETSDPSREMFDHVLVHGETLDAYLQLPAQEVAHAWRGVSAMHLGHVLWNDISGIGNLVDAVPARQLPRFLVFDAASGPEMYGPLDEIFPELKGKITREAGTFAAAIPSFYRERLLLIKSTSLRVSRSLRERITSLLLRRSANTAYVAEARAAAEHSSPIIVLGLRTENRTLTDLPGFCERMLAFLAQRIDRATLVVDGHSSLSGVPGQLIRSHGETPTSQASVAMELEILAALQRRAAGTGIGVVSTIGLPLEASLIWSCHSAFFVTMWGAGLAKYRWVCNKPGLVITSRWNLRNRSDLRIYDAPLFQEDPAPVEFIDAAAVHDRPDAPLQLQPGSGLHPSIMNFELDEQAAFRIIGGLMDRCLGSLAA